MNGDIETFADGKLDLFQLDLSSIPEAEAVITVIRPLGARDSRGARAIVGSAPVGGIGSVHRVTTYRTGRLRGRFEVIGVLYTDSNATFGTVPQAKMSKWVKV